MESTAKTHFPRILTISLAFGISASLATWIFLSKVSSKEPLLAPLATVISPPVGQPISPATAKTAPLVDVVFVLDTTSSMSGMIDGAKKKIWEIARFIAQGQPTPKLRVGLVGFRDQGDAYVTKAYDLTDDLDQIYTHLTAFQAEGGGDGPEHVYKGLHEAIHNSSWSKDNQALKIVYLVGDAPPHTDYKDGYDPKTIISEANQKGIHINTIRCGNDESTKIAWMNFSSQSGGDFSTIEQSGGVVQTTTPYDEELAQLNLKLTQSAIVYGSADKKEAVRSKVAVNMAAPTSVQAERAGLFGENNKAGRKMAALNDGDLVGDVEESKVSLSAIRKDELPEEMKNMSLDEQKQYLAQKAKDRQATLDKINEVSAKRDGYLKEHAKADASSLDSKIRESLKHEGKAAGIRF